MKAPKGFTVLEVMVVCWLTALLALLLSAAWGGVGKPMVDLIARAQLAREIDLAVASLSRDLGGSLANVEGRLGGKNLNRWVGWLAPSGSQLWLCYDGGTELNEEAEWGPPDTVIVYRVESDALVRWDQSTESTFVVAKNVENMQVSPEGSDGIRIVLSFKFRQLERTCTLIARTP